MATLHVAPWGSWKEWDCVRAALFSSSLSRITAAMARIAAWQCRGSVPVAVEITANIVSIHQRDPSMNLADNARTETALPEEMLRMMYAMSIMRLVNGVTDPEQRGSILHRALEAQLPRSLVDIRHDSAHGELPAIPLLRLASKKALEWLELFYWKQQKSRLEAARTKLKSKIIEYFSLLQSTYVPYESLQDQDLKYLSKVSKKRASVFRKLVDLSVQFPQDVVSILLDDGLLSQKQNHVEDAMITDGSSGTLCSTDDLAWKYTIAKLCEVTPQLLQMLALGLVRRLSGLESVADGAGFTFKHEDGNSSSKVPEKCTGFEASRLIDWLEWLLSSHVREAPKKSKKSLKERFEIELKCPLVGEITNQLKRELLALGLKGNVDRDVHARLIQVVAHVGNLPSSKTKRLLKLVVFRTRAEDESVVPELSEMELSLEKMRSEQATVLGRRTRDEHGEGDGDGDGNGKGSRKRWKVAEKWQPCAIGMLPSHCYFGGVRPDWLVDCNNDLCVEMDDNPPRPKEALPIYLDVIGGAMAVDESKGDEEPVMQVVEVDEHVEVENDEEDGDVEDDLIKGTILLGGKLTRLDRHMVESLSGQICIL